MYVYICGMYVCVLKKEKLWLKVPVYNERGIQMHHKSTIYSGLCFNIQKISSVKSARLVKFCKNYRALHLQSFKQLEMLPN